jgi:hypothetical protein
MKRGAALRAFMLAAMFALAATLLLAWPGVTRFFAMDGCLDRGGAWNHALNVCCFSEAECEQTR